MGEDRPIRSVDVRMRGGREVISGGARKGPAEGKKGTRSSFDPKPQSQTPFGCPFGCHGSRQPTGLPVSRSIERRFSAAFRDEIISRRR